MTSAARQARDETNQVGAVAAAVRGLPAVAVVPAPGPRRRRTAPGADAGIDHATPRVAARHPIVLVLAAPGAGAPAGSGGAPKAVARSVRTDLTRGRAPPGAHRTKAAAGVTDSGPAQVVMGAVLGSRGRTGRAPATLRRVVGKVQRASDVRIAPMTVARTGLRARVAPFARRGRSGAHGVRIAPMIVTTVGRLVIVGPIAGRGRSGAHGVRIAPVSVTRPARPEVAQTPRTRVVPIDPAVTIQGVGPTVRPGDPTQGRASAGPSARAPVIPGAATRARRRPSGVRTATVASDLPRGAMAATVPAGRAGRPTTVSVPVTAPAVPGTGATAPATQGVGLPLTKTPRAGAAPRWQVPLPPELPGAGRPATLGPIVIAANRVSPARFRPVSRPSLGSPKRRPTSTSTCSRAG